MHTSWQHALQSILESNTYSKLIDKIKSLRTTETIYPPEKDVFRALNLPIDQVKVVIIGQDPYFRKGQAHGLSFSVESDIQPPPSLVNIFKEIGTPTRRNGDLTNWMNQGVLLLNTILTVKEGQAKSHAKLGWQVFTMKVLQEVADAQSNIVFLCWGRDAQNVISSIKLQTSHLVLKASHPSPLGAHYAAPVPFTGCNHFNLVNEYLEQHNLSKIDWTI